MWTQGWQTLYDNAQQGVQDELANKRNLAQIAAEAKRYSADREAQRWENYTQAQRYEAELRHLLRPQIELKAKEQLYGQQMDQVLAKLQSQAALKELQMRTQEALAKQKAESALEVARIKQEPKDPLMQQLLQGTEDEPERRIKTLLQYQRLQSLLKSQVPNEKAAAALEKRLLLLLAGQDPDNPQPTLPPPPPIVGEALNRGMQNWNELPYWARGAM